MRERPRAPRRSPTAAPHGSQLAPSSFLPPQVRDASAAISLERAPSSLAARDCTLANCKEAIVTRGARADPPHTASIARPTQPAPLSHIARRKPPHTLATLPPMNRIRAGGGAISLDHVTFEDNDLCYKLDDHVTGRAAPRARGERLAPPKRRRSPPAPLLPLSSCTGDRPRCRLPRRRRPLRAVAQARGLPLQEDDLRRRRPHRPRGRQRRQRRRRSRRLGRRRLSERTTGNERRMRARIRRAA